MRVGYSGMGVADCFGCNFWKSGSPLLLLWWMPYRCILCRVLGPLSVAALQVSFLMSETSDKYFFDGAISGKETGVEGVVVVGEAGGRCSTWTISAAHGSRSRSLE